MDINTLAPAVLDEARWSATARKLMIGIAFLLGIFVLIAAIDFGGVR